MNKTIKTVAVILALVMALSLAACQKSGVGFESNYTILDWTMEDGAKPYIDYSSFDEEITNIIHQYYIIDHEENVTLCLGSLDFGIVVDEEKKVATEDFSQYWLGVGEAFFETTLLSKEGEGEDAVTIYALRAEINSEDGMVIINYSPKTLDFTTVGYILGTDYNTIVEFKETDSIKPYFIGDSMDDSSNVQGYYLMNSIEYGEGLVIRWVEMPEHYEYCSQIIFQRGENDPILSAPLYAAFEEEDNLVAFSTKLGGAMEKIGHDHDHEHESEIK